MADKYIKEIVSITNHQGNVNQTTLSYHLTHTGMTTVKKMYQVSVRMWSN